MTETRRRAVVTIRRIATYPLSSPAPRIPDAGVLAGQPVETTQIAPTILQLLGLDPNALKAVQQEGTPVLPTG